MTPDTVSPREPIPLVCVRVSQGCWVRVSIRVCPLNTKYLLEWKNADEGCCTSCWMLQSNTSTWQRYAYDYTCTPSDLGLWFRVCLPLVRWCHKRRYVLAFLLLNLHLDAGFCALGTVCVKRPRLCHHPSLDLFILPSIKWLVRSCWLHV